MPIINLVYEAPNNEHTSYEEFNFPSGTYPGWTVSSGSFAQGSIGSGWITAGQSSYKCTMYKSKFMSKFKMQHRCYVSRTTRGGSMGCGLSSDTTYQNSITAFGYGLTTAWGYDSGSAITIQGNNVSTGLSLSNGYYIDEIIFDGTKYTVNLYQDNNGTPGTLLYTATATGTVQPYIVLYHEHGTSPYSQTNWVKLWYS